MQVGAVLDARRRVGNDAADDVIGGLFKTTVNGGQLADDEIPSIPRNWAGGELRNPAPGIGLITGHTAVRAGIANIGLRVEGKGAAWPGVSLGSPGALPAAPPCVRRGGPFRRPRAATEIFAHGRGAAHWDSAGQSKYIVSPELLTPERETMICGQCHSRPKGATGTDSPNSGCTTAPAASRA